MVEETTEKKAAREEEAVAEVAGEEEPAGMDRRKETVEEAGAEVEAVEVRLRNQLEVGEEVEEVILKVIPLLGHPEAVGEVKVETLLQSPLVGVGEAIREATPLLGRPVELGEVKVETPLQSLPVEAGATTLITRKEEVNNQKEIGEARKETPVLILAVVGVRTTKEEPVLQAVKVEAGEVNVTKLLVLQKVAVAAGEITQVEEEAVKHGQWKKSLLQKAGANN